METHSGARQRSRHHCNEGTNERKDHVSPRRAAEYFIPPEANLGSFYTQAKILRRINYAAAVRNIKAPLNWGDLCGGSSGDDFPFFFARLAVNVTLDCAIDVMVLETSPGLFLAPPFPPSCRFHAALRYVAVLCTNPSGSDQRHTSPAHGTI